MPLLTVKHAGGELRVNFDPGPSLRAILDTTEVRVRAACRGMGACGLCHVRIVAGEVEPPTISEQIHLEYGELAEGVRLACQVVPGDDLHVEILAPTPLSAWRSLPAGEILPVTRQQVRRAPEAALGHRHSYGLAIDLGTTFISLVVINLADGRRLAGRHGLNPQIEAGADVMTRLIVATEAPVRAQALSWQVIEAIAEALFDIAIREGFNLQQISRVVLVGNTPMLALLSGRNYDRLLQPSYWMQPIDCLPEQTATWVEDWGINPQASISVVPPLAGFVGSDLLVGVLATAMTEHGSANLLIDVGTNSEIALWDGSQLWVTSAAGGPAFEGSGLSCGMPAEPGAIYRVGFTQTGLDLAVIGEGEPQGICGSGLIDLMAGLFSTERLTAIGRFAADVPANGFVFARGRRTLRLTRADVDVFQRAKAAIATGVQVLLREAGLAASELQRICVCGSFGRFLNLPNAQLIGLLPSLAPERIEICGNTALAGAEDLLLLPAAEAQLAKLHEQAHLINMSYCVDFDDFFFENLYLKSW